MRKTTARLVELAFREDLGERGDITTAALGVPEKTISASIIAKQTGVFCGLEVAQMAFHFINPAIKINCMARDGERVTPRQVLLRLDGPGAAMLSAERTALNFLGRLSGIATLTRQFVDAVAGTRAKILDTRKTMPGWRLLEKYAVKKGGGVNHRIGLYDMFLIKENHIAAAGGITSAVNACRNFMARENFQAEIEVETQTLADVREALALKVDRIMLDNMQLELMRECVQVVAGKIPLEASGNVSLATVRAIAETGVDYISIGALTHSAPVFDVSLLVDN